MIARKETIHCLAITNQPGELAKITGAIAEKGINILGIFAEEGAGQSLVNLVFEQQMDQQKLENITGVSTTQKEVLAIECTSKIGSIAYISRKLGDNNLNIGSIFGTECPSSRDFLCYIEVDDIPKALKIFSE